MESPRARTVAPAGTATIFGFLAQPARAARRNRRRRIGMGAMVYIVSGVQLAAHHAWTSRGAQRGCTPHEPTSNVERVTQPAQRGFLHRLTQGRMRVDDP